MTRSGQLRSGSRMGSTSSANGRYRLTGIDEPRWGFQAGLAGTGRARRVDDGSRRDVSVRAGRFGKLVTVRCSGVVRRNFRPAHREHPRREAGLDQTPSRRPRRSTRCTL